MAADDLPAPAGLTPHQYGGLLAWARRREKYGSSGMPPATSALFSERLRARLPAILAKRRQAAWARTRCRHGHRLTAENIRLKCIKGTVVRACRICQRLNSAKGIARPRWVEHDGARIGVRQHDTWYRRVVATLRARMVAAHPDKGGTSARFIKARRVFTAFMATEVRWYAAIGLKPPRQRKPLAAAAHVKRWATRRARYGPSGQRDPQAQCAKAWALRRERDPEHAFAQKTWAKRRAHFDQTEVA